MLDWSATSCFPTSLIFENVSFGNAGSYSLLKRRAASPCSTTVANLLASAQGFGIGPCMSCLDMIGIMVL